MIHPSRILLLCLASVAVTQPVTACVIVPPIPQPPPAMYVLDGIVSVNNVDFQKVAVGFALDGLFAPNAVTNCQCGSTFINGVAIPHIVTDAFVAIFDPNTMMNVMRVSAFDAAFASANGTVTALLNSIVPSPNWTGFGGAVNPFVATLPPGDIFKLWFDYQVPVSQLGQFETSSWIIAGGSTDPGHQLGFQPSPEPGTVGLLASGTAVLVLLIRSRRRSARG